MWITLRIPAEQHLSYPQDDTKRWNCPHFRCSSSPVRSTCLRCVQVFDMKNKKQVIHKKGLPLLLLPFLNNINKEQPKINLENEDRVRRVGEKRKTCSTDAEKGLDIHKKRNFLWITLDKLGCPHARQWLVRGVCCPP